MKLIHFTIRTIRNIRDVLRFNIKNILFLYKNSDNYPLISIVIPLYNEERFIIDCLRSIKRQSYKNFECIIVNDCSTDNSKNFVQPFISNDQRFRLIDHKENKGLPSSRNTGLQNSNGPLFLDGHKNKLIITVCYK